MSRFVRPSKYRHVYGNPAKKEGCYDNVKVSNNAWDTNLVAANGRYVSVNWQASGGGAFAVIPTANYGKLPDIYPLCRGHSAPVLDTAFSPFNDQMLASASDDGTIGVWKVDDTLFDVLDMSEKEKEKAGGVKDMHPVAKIAGGSGRKVGQVLFHPTANNVMAAASGDHIVRLYDIEAGVAKVELKGFTDAMQSFDFDWTGSTLVATSRDRKLRTFDTRKGGDPVQVAESHGGIKGARVVWCGSLDRIITTGFSKMSDRQLFLWDSTNLSKPLKSITLDSSSGIIMPFWSDNNICFLAGKGDGNIRYYEYESDELHYLTEYKSTEPQRGLTFIPRRSLNTDENEIARAMKVTGNMVQPISFLVPRRADSFQSDIFPPAPSDVPALSAAEFFAGKTSMPNLINLDDKSGVLGKPAEPPKQNGAASAPAPVPAAVPKSSFSPSPSPLPAPAAGAAPAASPAAETPNAAPVHAPAPVVSEPAAASNDGASDSKVRGARCIVHEESALDSDLSCMHAQVKELEALVEKLKIQLAQKDTTMRELELENEKLKTKQQKLRDALVQ
ncbi:putative CRN1 [Tilletiaria anomala UBC 951]|uniref:Coronin n=1 Tax=Tilletiaria anomala (strain ATCC 24038 / CBS 436.72 / UBC 951) TaxID=1037660 RepID=A0A066VQK4_TILAU|nr:putative CRN1 [Tilletiaria anomala UBC 951]KDN41079.1 putative CRN1 [Tilletiaria anomala UBC 951]